MKILNKCFYLLGIGISFVTGYFRHSGLEINFQQIGNTKFEVLVSAYLAALKEAAKFFSTKKMKEKSEINSKRNQIYAATDTGLIIWSPSFPQ